MHILLIEPDRILAATYQQALESKGHSVIMCASAQSAIYAVDDRQPDLILLELQLIGHSGFEFLYEFRSYPEWQDIPVIIHTQVPAGEFTDSWEFMKQQFGIIAYLYKPLTSIHDVLRTVEERVKQVA